jgi:hypothetical protein
MKQWNLVETQNKNNKKEKRISTLKRISNIFKRRALSRAYA